MEMKKLTLVTAISAIALAGCGEERAEFYAKKLSKKIKEDNLVEHLNTLQLIANENPVNDQGTRAAGTSGYDSSADYVKSMLEDAGYDVTLQPFDFRAWEQLALSDFTLSTPEDPTGANIEQPNNQGDDPAAINFATMSYSGSGDIAPASIAFVTPSFGHSGDEAYDYTDGCEKSDFDGKQLEGKIAVIQRGGCTFDTKASNAQSAGASSAIIFNDGTGEGRMDVFGGTLGEDSQTTIPVISASFGLGQQMFELKGGMAAVKVQAKDGIVVTNNVIAETKGGNADQVVMLGAHLDSVQEGPGINDNGTGSAGLLEYALKFAKFQKKTTNKVRFAWWSAEESGLVGSQFYADDLFGGLQETLFAEIATEMELDPTDLSGWTQEQYDAVTAEVEVRFVEQVKVKLYLNFDMIGSPNPVYFVYDGDLSDTMDDPANAYDENFLPPFGTADVEKTFNKFYESHELKTAPSALSKRSDYAGFADYGIAFGGLFTGAEVAKTEEQVAIWGGTAGEAYDKCYHQTCDDTTNIQSETFTYNAKALAYTGTMYAMRDELFPVEEEETTEPETMARAMSVSLSVDKTYESFNFANRGMEYDEKTGLAKFISHGHEDIYFK